LKKLQKLGIDITENTCEYCDRDDVYGWKTASKWKKEDERLNPKENKTNEYKTRNPIIMTQEILKLSKLSKQN